MKIGELSRVTGVSVRLIRYYEAQGLLTPDRSEGGQRRYGATAPATVARIRALLAAGLPTRVIRDLMACFIGDGIELQACVVDHLKTQYAELDARIDDLSRARAALGDILEASTRALAHT